MAKPKDTKPTAAEFEAFVTWLISKGFKKADLDTAIGTIVNNRTRAQIALDVVTHLKKSKKKKA